MSCLPKPVLRGHAHRKAIKIIAQGLAVSAASGSLYYFLVKQPYQRAYDDFIKNHDEVQHFKNLVKWGYYQTVKKE